MSTPLLGTLPTARAGSGVSWRPYAGLEELGAMARANAHLRERVGLLEPIDLEAMRHRYTHLVNSDPLTDCVIGSLDGVTVAYGRVEWDDLTDGDRVYTLTITVDPVAWGRGVADSLLTWCEARIVVIARGHAGERRSWFGTYTFDGDTELETTLRATGYRPVRWFAELLRDTMDALPPVAALPPGYEIRPVPADRIDDVGRMLILAFHDHWGETDQGDEAIRDWVEDPRFDIDLVSVVWDGDEPVACASTQVHTRTVGDLTGPIGYVDNVATHPAHRRQGLARAALVDNLHRMKDRGLPRAYLGVDTDNRQRAFALYEDLGFHKVSGTAAYRKPFQGGTT